MKAYVTAVLGQRFNSGSSHPNVPVKEMSCGEGQGKFLSLDPVKVSLPGTSLFQYHDLSNDFKWHKGLKVTDRNLCTDHLALVRIQPRSPG
jgi:hypothetical protein